MKFGEKIAELRKRYNLTQNELSIKVGVSRARISHYEKNRREPDFEIAKKIAEVFGVSTDYLLNVREVLPKAAIPLENARVISLPVYGKVRAGVGGIALQEYLGTQSWIVKNGYCDGCYMLKIEGDSMYPRYFPGDFAIVRPQSDVDNGDVAIVIVDGEEGTIKRIKKVPNGIILQSDNSLHKDREFYGKDAAGVMIVGKVIDIKPGRL